MTLAVNLITSLVLNVVSGLCVILLGYCSSIRDVISGALKFFELCFLRFYAASRPLSAESQMTDKL